MTFVKVILCGALVAATMAIFSGAPTSASAQDFNNRGVPARPGRDLKSTPGDAAACINGTGLIPTIAYHKGALGVSRPFPGTYLVSFNRDVTNCVMTATIGLCGSVGVEQPGSIAVVRSVVAVNDVFVTTHDAFGARSDRSFHLLVTCE